MPFLPLAGVRSVATDTYTHTHIVWLILHRLHHLTLGHSLGKNKASITQTHFGLFPAAKTLARDADDDSHE